MAETDFNTKNFQISVSSISKKDRLNQFIKRAFDIVFSLVALIIFSPLLALIAIAIKRDSCGPVLYRGQRVGFNGKNFQILKFRTMFENSESYSGPRVTAHDDKRITQLGHWLRSTKLNELPQFWNVLRGDMSMVGPRPEDPEIAKTWPEDVRRLIFSVRPGITSPASIQYRDEEAMLSSSNVLRKYFDDLVPDKNRLDQLYVRYHSFWMDLDTLFWTCLILLPLIRSQNPPEDLLFVGPFTRLVRRYLNWFVIDLVVTFTAMALTGITWRIFGPLDIGWSRSIMIAIGYSLLFSLVGVALGINRISWTKATFADGYDLIPAWFLATLLVFFGNNLLKAFPVAMVIVASVLALVGFLVTRYRTRLLGALLLWASRRWNVGRGGRERVIVVGVGAVAQHAAWLLNLPSNLMKYWLVGLIDDDMFTQGMRYYGINVIGRIKDIPRLVEKYDIGVIILADYRMNKKSCRPIANLCKKTGTRLIVLPDFYSSFRLLNIEPGLIPVTSSDEASLNEMNCIRCMTKFACDNLDTSEEDSGHD